MMTTFFKQFFFTITVSGAIVMETYVFCSAFFGAYKLFQVYDSKGGLTLKDVGKFYLAKYLRLAPYFYFVFFASWALFPYMGVGPMWYSSHMMYDGCKDYWWAQVLFVSNIVPYFQAPNYGCFYWSWIVVCDMQLALLIPLYVVIYRRTGQGLGQLFCWTMIA
jgi:hypothetical protein